MKFQSEIGEEFKEAAVKALSISIMAEEEEEEKKNHGLLHQEQVIMDIVSWLPFDSVLQCRCVCKTWNSLLHEPYFTQLHTHRSSTFSSSPLSLFRLVRINCVHSIGVRSIVRLEDYYDDEQQQQQQLKVIISKPLKHVVVILPSDYIGIIWLVGSCNGLICLFDYNGYYIVPVFIYNPITKEYVILPHVGWDDESKHSIIMNGGGGGVSASGFGYHPSTNEYKVVRIIHISSSNTSSYIRYVRIYTLGSSHGKWRIKEDEQVEYKFEFKGVLANGALYWLTVNGAKIVSFDLEDEKFRIISPSPPPLSLLPLEELTEKAGFDVGVLGQSLCITVQKGYVTDIWVMNTTNNNNNKWNKEFSISTSIPPTVGDSRNYCELVGFTKRGRILCVYNRKHLICYDPITNSYDPHDYSVGSDIPPAIVTDYFPRVVPYRKSLVSLKALGEDAKVVEPGEEDAEVVEPGEEDEPVDGEQRYGLHMAVRWFGIHNHQEFFGERRVPSRIYSCSFTNNSILSGSVSNSPGDAHSGDMKTKIVKLCMSFVLSLLSSEF